MTKYKVSELDGAALDAAVAHAEISHHLSWSDTSWPPKFSTDWACGGPIIERERDIICKYLIDTGESITWIRNADLAEWMRAYVASRFGDEVELP